MVRPPSPRTRLASNSLRREAERAGATNPLLELRLLQAADALEFASQLRREASAATAVAKLSEARP